MNLPQNGVSLISDRKYAFFRQGATIVLPAFGALYFALASIWDFPKAEEIVGTIAALNVFFGLVTTVAQKVYDVTGAKYDGTLDVKVNPEDGSKVYSLNVSGDINQFGDREEVTFKVNK